MLCMTAPPKGGAKGVTDYRRECASLSRLSLRERWRGAKRRDGEGGEADAGGKAKTLYRLVVVPRLLALSVSLRLTAPPEGEPRGLRIIEEHAPQYLPLPPGEVARRKAPRRRGRTAQLYILLIKKCFLYPKYFCIRLSNSNCVSSSAFCIAAFDLSVCSTKAANCSCSSIGGQIKGNCRIKP